MHSRGAQLAGHGGLGSARARHAQAARLGRHALAAASCIRRAAHTGHALAVHKARAQHIARDRWRCTGIGCLLLHRRALRLAHLGQLAGGCARCACVDAQPLLLSQRFICSCYPTPAFQAIYAHVLAEEMKAPAHSQRMRTWWCRCSASGLLGLLEVALGADRVHAAPGGQDVVLLFLLCPSLRA